MEGFYFSVLQYLSNSYSEHIKISMLRVLLVTNCWYTAAKCSQMRTKIFKISGSQQNIQASEYIRNP